MRGNVILPHPKPTASMPHLNNLNDRQHQAVISKDKRLLVLAGAGSGKTKTLLPKIICPIEEKGVSPSSIPANTFRLTIWHHAVSKLSCLSIVALFLSCNKPAPRQAAHKPPAPPVRICIQPFTGISEAEVNHVAGRIRGFYHSVKVLPAIELPAKAYYAPRNRHKADSLLQFLGSYKNVHRFNQSGYQHPKKRCERLRSNGSGLLSRQGLCGIFIPTEPEEQSGAIVQSSHP
jgi:hypothetical protein